MMTRLKMELRRTVELNIPDQSEFLKNGNIQDVIWMEEMSELQQAISKCLRGKENRNNLIEETADVIICLTQLCEKHGITAEELQKMIDKKHKRNAERQAKQDHVYKDENLIE